MCISQDAGILVLASHICSNSILILTKSGHNITPVILTLPGFTEFHCNSFSNSDKINYCYEISNMTNY